MTALMEDIDEDLDVSRLSELEAVIQRSEISDGNKRNMSYG